jgi:hypothetical protein
MHTYAPAHLGLVSSFWHNSVPDSPRKLRASALSGSEGKSQILGVGAYPVRSHTQNLGAFPGI